MNAHLLFLPVCLALFSISGCSQIKATRMTSGQLIYPMMVQTVPPTVHYYGSDDQYDYFKVLNLMTCKRKVPVNENLVDRKDRYPFTSWKNGKRMYYIPLNGLSFDKPELTFKKEGIRTGSAIDHLPQSPR